MVENLSQSGQEMEMSQTPQESHISGDFSDIEPDKQLPSPDDKALPEIPTFGKILEGIREQKATEAQTLHQQEIAEEALLDQLYQERLTACRSALQDHPRIQTLSSIFDNQRIMEAFEHVRQHWLSLAKDKRKQEEEARERNNLFVRWVKNRLFPLPKDEDIEDSVQLTSQLPLDKDQFAELWANSRQDISTLVDGYLEYHYNARYSNQPDITPDITAHFNSDLRVVDSRHGELGLLDYFIGGVPRDTSLAHPTFIAIEFCSNRLKMALKMAIYVDPSTKALSTPYTLINLQAENDRDIDYFNPRYNVYDDTVYEIDGSGTYRCDGVTRIYKSCTSIDDVLKEIADCLTSRKKKQDK
jgi:hypothetical protein